MLFFAMETPVTPMDAATHSGTVERGEIEGNTRSAQAPDRNEFVSQLSESIGRRANVGTVFGEPVNHGAVSVIPVASVSWGFGGGSGGSRPDGAPSSGADPSAETRRHRRWGIARGGGGGGGGANLHPVGYILIRDDDAEFRPIRMVPPFAIALTGLMIGVALGASRRRGR